MKKNIRLPEKQDYTFVAFLTCTGILLFILTCSYFNKPPTCIQSYSDFIDYHYHIILTKKPLGNQRDYRITGIHRESGWEFEKRIYNLYKYNKYLQIGDTIVKLKGKNHFTICKEKYRIYHLVYCKNEKEYTNSFIDSHYRFKLDESPIIDSALSIKNIYK